MRLQWSGLGNRSGPIRPSGVRGSIKSAWIISSRGRRKLPRIVVTRPSSSRMSLRLIFGRYAKTCTRGMTLGLGLISSRVVRLMLRPIVPRSRGSGIRSSIIRCVGEGGRILATRRNSEIATSTRLALGATHGRSGNGAHRSPSARIVGGGTRTIVEQLLGAPDALTGADTGSSIKVGRIISIIEAWCPRTQIVMLSCSPGVVAGVSPPTSTSTTGARVAPIRLGHFELLLQVWFVGYFLFLFFAAVFLTMFFFR